MISKRKLIPLASLLVFFLASCSPGTAEIQPNSNPKPIATPTAMPGEYPKAVQEVIKMYLATSSFHPTEVEVASFEPAEWSDSCLGLAFPDEMCAEVITPGWVVVLYASPDGVGVFHTDLAGEKMRRAPETDLPTKATLLHPPGTRTDIQDVDVIIDAILSNDIESRKELIHYTQVGCTTADGLGGPPKCEPGEVEGTLIEVLPILGSEGHHTRRAEIDKGISFSVEGLYAVYLMPEDVWHDESYPAGDYGLVFVLTDNKFLLTVHVKDGRIVRLDYDVGVTPAEVIEQEAGELLLPPLAGVKIQNPTP